MPSINSKSPILTHTVWGVAKASKMHFVTLLLMLAANLAFAGEISPVEPTSETTNEAPNQDTFFSFAIELNQSASGSLTLTGSFGAIEDTFLLDTGANMITVNRELFQKLRKLEGTVKVRQVGARMASGKVNLIDVYRVENFSIGNDCEIGSVEVAVVGEGGRNLLGMNALAAAAPFAVFTSPPSLAVSQCTSRVLATSVAQSSHSD